MTPPSDAELHQRALRRALWGSLGLDGPPGDDVAPAPRREDPRREDRPRGSRRAVRIGRWLAVLFAGLVLAAGCDHREGAVVLWHAYNGGEREALTRSVARWNAAHPERSVDFVAVPFGAFGDKLTSAIPNGNGPDLFIYPQDRLGGWVDSGVIEPIEFWLDDARADRFTREALGTLAYKGSVWGLPVTVKSLALYYRTDLVAAPPRTTDELLALAPRMRARDGYAIAYTNVDLYGHAPWLYGHGGKLLDDTGALAIASDEAAAALAFAKHLADTRAAPRRAEGDYVATLFNEGKAATAVSGPWFIASIADGVPWAVAPLPTVSSTGQPAAPFLGVEGLIMSARAKDKGTAFAVMDFLTSDREAIERVRIGRQVVPNPAADAEIAADPVLAAFRAQLAHAVPMAMDPAMRMVWTPYKTAIGEVLAGRAEPGAQLLAVEREVRGYLDGAR